MAASVMATTGLVSTVPVRTGLSSSASFGSPLVSVAPIRPAAKRNVMIARAALPQEQSGKTARREMLASLMAAGAVFATAGQSIAASTNDLANDLLKKADKLTEDESPPRYTPGRVDGPDDTNRIAQKGGAGAIPDLQGAGGGAVEGAKSGVAKAKEGIEGVTKKKFGDFSDASSVIDDAGKKVKSDIDTTQGKVTSDVDTTKKEGGSFIADAQKSIEGGKGAVGGLFEKLTQQ